MRRLLPAPMHDLDRDDLLAAYPVPDRPAGLVRANFVTSTDGAAEWAGRSDPLSGPADKGLFALLRTVADVVLVGAGTIRVERYGPARPDPQRQAWRRARGLPAVPPIAVVTGRIGLDLGTPFFTAAATRPLVFTTTHAPPERRAAAAEVADVVLAGADRVDIGRVLDVLAERGLTRVLCEGGPRLFTQVAETGRLDELCLTLSPVLAGPHRGRMVDGEAFASLLGLALAHVLEEDGALFLRYTRGRN